MPTIIMTRVTDETASSIARSRVLSKNKDSQPSSRIRKATKTLDDQEYYHGILPREEINLLLQKEGDFIVRESRKDNISQIVLSVMWDNGPKHFLFLNDEEGFWMLEGKAFRSVPELVDYYYLKHIPVTNTSGALLLRPRRKEKWELHNDDIQLGKALGKGHFGEVFRATLINSNGKIQVAVKTCHTHIKDEDKRKFVQEARIMRGYVHPNIVRFIGIAAQKHPMMLVMELVAGGSLKQHLRKNKDKLKTNEKLKFCMDASQGMEYLETKNCIHRDLAARNCLLDDKLAVKISDFGMSAEEEVFQATHGKQIPIKWTAPEALTNRTYTSKSDVWSFGVLMWEIWSEGEHPYKDKKNRDVIDFVKMGGRMELPDGVPDTCRSLMLQCWEEEPRDRPTFAEICKILEKSCERHHVAIGDPAAHRFAMTGVYEHVRGK